MKTCIVVGGSGYIGGEMVRLILQHPDLELIQVTSERFAKKPLHIAHPNLRGQSQLRYTSAAELLECDIAFVALPHGGLMNAIGKVDAIAEVVVDLSEDFRASSEEQYNAWHTEPHTNPAWLQKFVYGIPELHREELKTTNYMAMPGCNPTATILGLYPLYKAGVLDEARTVVDAKISSSAAGNKANLGTHHAERSRAVRSYRPTGHRHSGEMIQELGTEHISFSATAIELVRGILVTAHTFLNEESSELTDKDIRKIYREAYSEEPFIRIVKDKSGPYRYPEPKIVQGTNFCDIGFERDATSNRVVVVSAIDNLTRGSAGQAIQAVNIRFGWDETTGLNFFGLHPL